MKIFFKFIIALDHFKFQHGNSNGVQASSVLQNFLNKNVNSASNQYSNFVSKSCLCFDLQLLLMSTS